MILKPYYSIKTLDIHEDITRSKILQMYIWVFLFLNFYTFIFSVSEYQKCSFEINTT